MVFNFFTPRQLLQPARVCKGWRNSLIETQWQHRCLGYSLPPFPNQYGEKEEEDDEADDDDDFAPKKKKEEKPASVVKVEGGYVKSPFIKMFLASVAKKVPCLGKGKSWRDTWSVLQLLTAGVPHNHPVVKYCIEYLDKFGDVALLSHLRSWGQSAPSLQSEWAVLDLRLQWLTVLKKHSINVKSELIKVFDIAQQQQSKKVGWRFMQPLAASAVILAEFREPKAMAYLISYCYGPLKYNISAVVMGLIEKEGLLSVMVPLLPSIPEAEDGLGAAMAQLAASTTDSRIALCVLRKLPWDSLLTSVKLEEVLSNLIDAVESEKWVYCHQLANIMVFILTKGEAKRYQTDKWYMALGPVWHKRMVKEDTQVRALFKKTPTRCTEYLSDLLQKLVKENSSDVPMHRKLWAMYVLLQSGADVKEEMLDRIGYVREPAGIPQNMREGIIRGCIPTSLPDTALGLKVEYIFVAKKDTASGYSHDPGAMLRKIKSALSAAGIKTGNPFIEHDENPGVCSTGQLMLLQIAYEKTHARVVLWGSHCGEYVKMIVRENEKLEAGIPVTNRESIVEAVQEIRRIVETVAAVGNFSEYEHIMFPGLPIEIYGTDIRAIPAVLFSSYFL